MHQIDVQAERKNFEIPRSNQSKRTKLSTIDNSLTMLLSQRYLRERQHMMVYLLKSNSEKFSLTLDEWTSLRNRRYLHICINIHGIGYFWNL